MDIPCGDDKGNNKQQMMSRNVPTETLPLPPMFDLYTFSEVETAMQRPWQTMHNGEVIHHEKHRTWNNRIFLSSEGKQKYYSHKPRNYLCDLRFAQDTTLGVNENVLNNEKS